MLFDKIWKDKINGSGSGEGKQVGEQKNSEKLADEARGSGINVANEMEAMVYQDHSGRIPEETIKKYQSIVTGLAGQLKEAEALGIDTGTIDRNLEKLVTLLQRAIEKGYQKYISDVFVLIKEILQKERTNITGTTEEREWELEQRNLRVSRRTAIMEYKFNIEELNDSISELMKDIAYGEQRDLEVTEQLRKMNNENPELADKIKKIALTPPGEAIDPKVLELDARRKRVIRVRNGIKQSQQIRQMKEMRKDNLEKNISTLEHQLLAAGNMLQPELIQMHKKFQEQFEEALLREKQENEELERINDEFDASLEEFFSDPELINRIIKTNIAFDEMMKREQKDAEARAHAQKQRRQEEQLHSETMQLNAN